MDSYAQTIAQRYSVPCCGLMVDSSAYTAWTKGQEIDIQKYADYVNRHPGYDIAVNLDVIPGRPHDASSRTTQSIEHACQRSWENYLWLRQNIHTARVLPVFHQFDDFRWLRRYLDETDYIGISPSNDQSSKSRYCWLKDVERYIGRKRLIDRSVKTHGFGIAGLRSLQWFPWYSADSSSFLMSAGFGGIYVPARKGRGGWDYTYGKVFTVSETESSSGRRSDLSHGTSARRLVQEWLEEVGVEWGESEYVECKVLPPAKQGVQWAWAKKGQVAYWPKSPGVCNSYVLRLLVNLVFFQRYSEQINVAIYLSGGPIRPYLERLIQYRLLAYWYFDSGSGGEVYGIHAGRKSGKAIVGPYRGFQGTSSVKVGTRRARSLLSRIQ